MSITKLYKFKDISEVMHFLNGGVTGGSVNKAQGGGSLANIGAGFNGLVGLTLKFKQPSVSTVTFVASSGVGGSAHSPSTNPDPNTLLLLDVKLQVEAVLAGVSVSANSDGRIRIVEKTPASGVTIDKTGTANAILGFDSANDEVGKVYAAPGTVTPAVAPAWVWAYAGNDNMHTVWVIE